MKTLMVLMEHKGELASSRLEVIGMWQGQADLRDSKIVLQYPDSELRSRVPRWRVAKCLCPDWMDSEEWLRREPQLRFLEARGLSLELLRVREVMDKLASLFPIEQLIAARLLATNNFRSSYRSQAKDVLLVWLSGGLRCAKPWTLDQVQRLHGPWDINALHMAEARMESQGIPAGWVGFLEPEQADAMLKLSNPKPTVVRIGALHDGREGAQG